MQLLLLGTYPKEIGTGVHNIYQNVQGVCSKISFEISVDSHVVVRNNTAGSHALCPVDPNGNTSQTCSTIEPPGH